MPPNYNKTIEAKFGQAIRHTFEFHEGVSKSKVHQFNCANAIRPSILNTPVRIQRVIRQKINDKLEWEFNNMQVEVNSHVMEYENGAILVTFVKIGKLRNVAISTDFFFRSR